MGGGRGWVGVITRIKAVLSSNWTGLGLDWNWSWQKLEPFDVLNMGNILYFHLEWLGDVLGAMMPLPGGSWVLLEHCWHYCGHARELYCGCRFIKVSNQQGGTRRYDVDRKVTNWEISNLFFPKSRLDSGMIWLLSLYMYCMCGTLFTWRGQTSTMKFFLATLPLSSRNTTEHL